MAAPDKKIVSCYAFWITVFRVNKPLAYRSPADFLLHFFRQTVKKIRIPVTIISIYAKQKFFFAKQEIQQTPFGFWF